jgi:hypothetical protein
MGQLLLIKNNAGAQDTVVRLKIMEDRPKKVATKYAAFFFANRLLFAKPRLSLIKSWRSFTAAVVR